MEGYIIRMKSHKHCIITWIMTGCLVIGNLTGCTNRTDTSTSDGVVSSDQKTQISQQTVDHNENEDSNLGAWGRAMGAVLISMNDGNPYYFGGYETTEANKKAAKNILKTSWNISNRKDLLKQIDYLLITGNRTDYRREAKGLKALSPKKKKKALKQVSGPLKIHYDNLQYISDTWGKRGLLAWDLCRISHLVQWGYIADYINLDEAQALLEPAAQKIKKEFDNWNDVVYNWLDGYAYSNSIQIRSIEKTDYTNRREIYEKLVNDQTDRDPLYDDNLFHEDIISLGTVTYKNLMNEIKPKKKNTKKSVKIKNQTNKKRKDSEEKTK